MRIIKVEEVDMRGYSGDIKYFISLKKAKKYFKKLFNYNKSNLVDEGDGVQSKPVYIRNFQQTPRLKGKRYKEACMELWHSCETDCGTEWDTSIVSIILEEIKIESEC